jgi:hypothetical protein
MTPSHTQSSLLFKQIRLEFWLEIPHLGRDFKFLIVVMGLFNSFEKGE